jgi:ribosome maturation factor RimP
MERLTTAQVQEKVRPMAERIFQAQGMDLIELKVSGNPHDMHIQVIADRPGGGINVGECAVLNKSLVAAIEQDRFLPREIFSLEVSSPGIDRPHKSSNT